MYRKGKFTKKRTPIEATTYFLKRRWKGWKELPRWKKLTFTLGPLAAFLIIVPILTYAYYYNYISDVDKLLNKNNTGVVLTDRNGKAFFSTGKAEHRDLVKLKDISKDAQRALLSAEDKDFYNHGGFSITGYARAFTGLVASGSIKGGGSTLTLQLAKNTLLTDNQNFFRKYQELTIAVAIEQRYTKDEILEMYLNSVFYGDNAFGIEDAAKTYFNKKPSKLSLAESAMIVGVLPAPSAYSPLSGDPELAKQRQAYVLTRMVEDGYITKDQKQDALNTKLKYAKQKSAIDNEAPHFTEMILNQLYEKYGEEVVSRSGYQVKTTLDLSLQKSANRSVDTNIAHVQANNGSNASLIALDPKTGGIRALVGSADYMNKKWGNVNMATTKRQPGSSFKPIYYADALASGKIASTTVIQDKYTDFGGYTPQNASRSFYGNVTVRQALNWSLNIPAVKVMQKEGVDNAVAAARQLGISTIDDKQDYGLSLALGTAEVPLDEMTNAYAAFANGGQQYETSSIESIDDKYGARIFTASKDAKRAISEQGAYLISNILSDNQTRSRLFGASLNVTGTDYQTKTAAVKTGTTENARDAWTIGYTPDVAVGVWVGNNDNTAMYSGGSDMAGPIWRDMMREAIGTKSPSFTQPAGIVKASVCIEVGIRTDVFLATNVPKQCEKKKQEKKTEEPKKVEKCTVAGKEDLDANDSKCVDDMCTIEGLTDLAANDPKCVEPSDSDKDGVNDSVDQCPGTPPNVEVDEVGCSQTQSPGSGNTNQPPNGNGTGQNGGNSTRPRGNNRLP